MNTLTKKIKEVTLKFRNTAYQLGETTSDYDIVPFGGSIKESIGPFPEFILKGRFCTRSLCGMCSPCFYSRLPIHNISDYEFDKGYNNQVQYISDHFYDKVKKNQVGKVAYDFDTDLPVYGMVCTPTGSYFDETEYPVQVRIENLRILRKMACDNQCEIALHIESHAEDVLRYFENPNKEEILLLQQLHTRILLGFESYDDFSRNGIYSKNLSLQTFERAVDTLKAAGFPVGAFVFAGLISMTEEEIKNDVKSSLLYLKELKVAPVLMFANTQSYTIPDVLLSCGKYKLLDPRTVYELVEFMVELFGCDMTSNIDPWFVADPVGGPPEPNSHIFNATTSTTCSKCGRNIYTAIEKLRISKDIKQFHLDLESVKACDCSRSYYDLLNNQKMISRRELKQRVEEAIVFAEKEFEYYVLQKNPWVVKAELLCHGLKLKETQKVELLHTNPFINEKGFINATHIKYKNTLINTCVAENFCDRSPFSLRKESSKWILEKNEIPIGEVSFISYPDWVYTEIDNQSIGSVIRPHSDTCLSIWPSTNCTFVNNNMGCQYCSLTSSYNRLVTLKPDTITKMVKEALKENPKYEVNLSGGTCDNPNKSVEYFCDICKRITIECGSIPISAEFTPPDDIALLRKLKDSGVSSVIMNLEIFDKQLRKKICPGKGSISRSHYFEALQEAVSIYGKGNVSSVLIVGIQSQKDIICGIDKLTEIGVIPTLIPIKPLDGTAMENHNISDYKEYIYLSKYVSRKMHEYDLKIKKNSGCASCGACSLEIDL